MGSSLGGGPANRTTPLSTPPSATTPSSYAACTGPASASVSMIESTTMKATTFERAALPPRPVLGEASEGAVEAPSD